MTNDQAASTLGQNLPAPVDQPKPEAPKLEDKTRPDAAAPRARVVPPRRDEETEQRIRVLVGQILDAVRHRLPTDVLGELERDCLAAAPAMVAAVNGDEVLSRLMGPIRKMRARMPAKTRDEFDGVLIGATEAELRNRLVPFRQSLADE